MKENIQKGIEKIQKDVDILLKKYHENGGMSFEKPEFKNAINVAIEKLIHYAMDYNILPEGTHIFEGPLYSYIDGSKELSGVLFSGALDWDEICIQIWTASTKIRINVFKEDIEKASDDFLNYEIHFRGTFNIKIEDGKATDLIIK